MAKFTHFVKHSHYIICSGKEIWCSFTLSQCAKASTILPSSLIHLHTQRLLWPPFFSGSAPSAFFPAYLLPHRVPMASCCSLQHPSPNLSFLLLPLRRPHCSFLGSGTVQPIWILFQSTNLRGWGTLEKCGASAIKANSTCPEAIYIFAKCVTYIFIPIENTNYISTKW